MSITLIIGLFAVAAILAFAAKGAKNINEPKVEEQNTKQKELDLECVKTADCKVGLFGRIRKKLRG